MQSQTLSSLANVTRLKLLICLSEGKKNVTELIEKCTLSQSAVSQHLEKLRSSGIVKSEKVGKEVYYTLVNPEVAKLSHDILNFVENKEK
jgi:ArsR family transcriptional regulator